MASRLVGGACRVTSCTTNLLPISNPTKACSLTPPGRSPLRAYLPVYLSLSLSFIPCCEVFVLTVLSSSGALFLASSASLSIFSLRALETAWSSSRLAVASIFALVMSSGVRTSGGAIMRSRSDFFSATTSSFPVALPAVREGEPPLDGDFEFV